MQHVERLAAVLSRHGFDHGGHIALEIAGLLLPKLLHADDADAGDRGWGAAAIHLAAESVATVLAEHRHVMPGRHQLPQQVQGIDAHARNGGEEASADEANPHCGMARR